jgi:hypothetical protein
MKRHPDGGMYSIKLVHPGHLNYIFFLPDTSNDGRPRLMNFSNQGRTPALAEGIRPGHRALVYVTRPVKKFIWAIEYTGTVQDGRQAASAVPVPSNDMHPSYCTVFLPIRFLATIIDVDSAPDAQDVCQNVGVDFTPNVFPMKHISAAEYHKIFGAIKWEWLTPTEPRTRHG